MSTRKPMPWWPLLLIAAPAAVAIWSGWAILASYRKIQGQYRRHP